MDDKEVLNILGKYKFVPWKTIDKEIINYLSNRFSDSSCISESYQRIKFGIEERPKCKICGGYVKWKGNKNYSTYCSQSCIAHDKDIIKQRNETCKTTPIDQDVVINNDTDIINYLSKFKQIRWNRLSKQVVNYLETRYQDSSSIKESWFRIFNNMEERPKCPICGGYVRFRELHGKGAGFSTYCSQTCINKDEKVRNKMRKTCLQNYGVDNPFKSDIIKQRMDITNLIKYGTIIPMNNCLISDKVKETSLRRYGVTNKAKTQEAINKSKQTYIKNMEWITHINVKK